MKTYGYLVAMEFRDESEVTSAQAMKNGLEYVYNTMQPDQPIRVMAVDVEFLGEIECYEGQEDKIKID